jgi:hypothetical protein
MIFGTNPLYKAKNLQQENVECVHTMDFVWSFPQNDVRVTIPK